MHHLKPRNKMSKLIKTLIIINGILIPTIIIIVFFQIFNSFGPRNNNNDDGIIIGDRLEEAKIDSVALQGLTYDNPIEIYNSTNYYLPISVTTYNEEKNLRKLALSSGDVGWSNYHVLNVIFLDKDYKVIGTLVEKKASIIDIEIPRNNYDSRESIDKSVKNIAYLIGFDDSNKDGKLNSIDRHDLFISDLNGMNLVQITKDIDVKTFEFKNSHSRILISYTERVEQKEEHKKVKFGLFDIASSKFTNLSNLNKELEGIEEELIN